MEFMREFPDDDACLEYLWRTRCSSDGETAHCPKCDQDRTFKRYKTAQRRQSWTCTACGHHVHPTAGTIFHKSPTSLQLWFYAMYLITSTRCGISAKHLERELGVHYKTAWRMFNKIRNQLMDENIAPLSGEVEMDETFVGGKPRQSDIARRKALGWTPQTDYWQRKAVVFAAVERSGGRIKASVIPTSRTLLLTSCEELELVEVDVLVAGAAAVGPAAQDGLQEQHRLRQCQAGRRALGHRRSSVRKACAQVTSAVWWWKPR